MRLTLRLLGLSAALFFLPGLLWAAEVPVRMNNNAEGGVFRKPVQSLKALRLRQTVAQSRDFSCGAAALATLLNYHFGQKLTEEDVILGMFKHGEQAEIRKRGFSLLDMKRYVQTINYQGEGYKVPELKLLQKLTAPVVTIVETNLFKHFVVLRGMDDKYAYISDPSWGNRKVALEDFEKIWVQKIIFVVQGPIVGTPEGLYQEKEMYAMKASEVLRKDITVGHRYAMDPSEAIIFQTNRPLVNIMPFIPGVKK